MPMPFCCGRNAWAAASVPSYPDAMAELIPLPTRPAREPEPLWRDALGDVLRRLRHERGERLADTARRAGVSPQYLSEVERGLKEPSSEMIAAIAGALDITLVALTLTVAEDLRAASGLRAVTELTSVAAPPLALPSAAPSPETGAYALAS